MFLREQILDGGLDPSAFSEYIAEQKEDGIILLKKVFIKYNCLGTDIDNWTLS
jgi:hypothetical protein